MNAHATPTMATLPALPKGALSPERQRLADAIERLRVGQAELAGLVLAEQSAIDMAHDAGQAVTAAEAAMAAAKVARVAETVAAMTTGSAGQSPIAHPASIAAKAAHNAATEAAALAAGIRATVAADINRLRAYSVPTRELSVLDAVHAVAKEAEDRFEALMRMQRESWSTGRDALFEYKRRLATNPHLPAPL